MAQQARKSDKSEASTPTPAGAEIAEAGRWLEEIAKAEKRYEIFRQDGKNTIRQYKSRDNQDRHRYQDKYNILYSSTETILPSLYTRTPQVEAVQRQKDTGNIEVAAATLVMEACTQYALEEMSFDAAIKPAIKDYVLPGLGQVWVRYEPVIETYSAANDSGKTEARQRVKSEGVAVDYVHYCDFLTADGRVWLELPWIARRVFFSKKKAIKRFGQEKANLLKYSFSPDPDKNGNGGLQAVIYEVWDKENREVVWVSKDYDKGLLDKKADPLKLKDFWPCPEPLRAVTTTDTFVPCSFYSQYKQQAEEINNITSRIRHLTKALKVVGTYDASQQALARILIGDENRMVPIDNWAAFASNGGINGAVQWVPIKDIALVLSELYKQREIAKAEIYEITGFSDITRGVSKASETLGAQQIKNEWAGGRLRSLQTDVQNFVRDTLRIVSEIIVEHFSEDTIATYCGFQPPEVTPEEQQAIATYGQAALSGQQPQGPPPQTGRVVAIQQFLKVVQLLKDEKQRCAKIGIETDSTIQPDESQERKDRLEFLGQIGAFLQQAGPMAMQFPDIRGLIGSLMMFAVHTFRNARPVEKEFQEFQKKLAAQPATPPPGQEKQGDNGQAAMQTAQIKAQSDQQIAQGTLQAKGQEVQAKLQLDQQKLKQDHDYNMAQLELKRQELALKERELAIKERELSINTVVKINDAQSAAQTAAHDQQLALRQQDHTEAMADDAAERQDRQFDATLAQQDADREASQNQVDE